MFNAVITENGKDRNAFNIEARTPLDAAKQIVASKNVVNGDVRMAYLAFDRPTHTFYAQEFAFAVTDGEVAIDSLVAL